MPAAPLLLRTAQERTGAAQVAALELVEDVLNLHPWPGFARTRGQVRLCCAIADHVHARATSLAGLGDPSRSLLATAREHWRVDIEETCVEGTDTLVFGTVTGSLPGFSQEVELHAGGEVAHGGTMAVEYPATDGQAQVCVRLADTNPLGSHTNTRLYSASCGASDAQQSDL